jgi:hypothetical protein
LRIGLLCLDVSIQTTFSLSFQICPTQDGDPAFRRLAVLLIWSIRMKSILAAFSQTTTSLTRDNVLGIALAESIFEEKIPDGVLFLRELLGGPVLWFTKRFLPPRWWELLQK